MARNIFDRAAFERGLQLLSRYISNSPILADYRPLELISSGGFVSVMHLGNRKSSQDFDYFLDQELFGERYETIRNELKRITTEVANQLHYDTEWANDEVRVFLTLLNNPQELFNRSKSQDVVIYRDNNIIVYAVLWEWVLVRKMKRLQMEGQRQRREDWVDVVSITKILYDRDGGPLDVQILRQFDHTEREPPVSSQTISNVRRLCQNFYQLDPFPERQREYWQWNGSQRRWDFIVEGIAKPENEWPAREGTGTVFCTDDGMWRKFDFGTNNWI